MNATASRLIRNANIDKVLYALPLAGIRVGKTKDELATEVGLSPETVAKALKWLSGRGRLIMKKDGAFKRYSRKNPS